MGDRVQLQQVLMNLIVNSIDAMKESGWDARVDRQVAENGERRSSGIRQRYRRWASPAAIGPDLQRVFYNEASRHRHGASHQPVHR